MKKVLFSFLLAGLMAWAGVATAQQTVTVGTPGDSLYTIPTNTCYNYSFTQFIYLSSDLNMGEANITDIAFYYAGPYSPHVLNRRVKIFLQNTSKSSFSSNTDFVSIGDTNYVLTGTLNPTQPGWVSLHLPLPFHYTGGNLLVSVYDTTGVDNRGYFRKTNTSTYRLIEQYSDLYKPDWANPSTSISSTYNQLVPNIRITYTPITPAAWPYTTNFSTAADNNQWVFKNWSLSQAGWYVWQGNGTNPKLMCGIGQDDYDTDFEETVFAYRKLQPTYADSIKVEFDLTVGGEGGPTDDLNGYYDYLSVFFVPGNISITALDDRLDWLLGGSEDFGFIDGGVGTYEWLRFGRDSLIENYKLVHRTGERMSCTFKNRWAGQQGNLVFVWYNNGSDGDGHAAQIDNVSVTALYRPAEYTPRSTAQWYAYAYWLDGDNYYPWQEHFLKFSMQNLANVDTASAHFNDDIFSGTYAGGYAWYNQGDYDKITRANINNGFISGAINYTWPSSLTGKIRGMQYNPVDDKIYFITSDKKLCSFDLSDPEHYTVMGTLTINISAFAINAQGEAYVMEDDTDGKLYRINLNNGTTTLVGTSGIYVTRNSAMAFDYNTGELFLAPYDDDHNHDGYGNTAMFYVNTSNGEMKYIGKLLNRVVEVTALFAQQSATPQGIATAQAAELSVYPNPAKDLINVAGVENGTLIKVYDMTGKLVVQQTANGNTKINVSGLNKGLYVIAAGASKVKFVKE